MKFFKNNNFINLQNQIDNCVDLGGYNITNNNILLSNQNKACELTISAPIH